jgi:hypothetical protein
MKKHLRHYTSLPYLLNTLDTKSLWLGDPTKWDDKNDSDFVEQYRKKKNLKKVFALCFAECGETYHHWKIYSDGVAGVCIQFNETELLNSIERVPGLRMGRLTYERIDNLKKHKTNPDIWPFLKRLPFEGEQEFRLILDYNEDDDIKAFPVKFNVQSIEYIFMSPWLSREAIGPVTKAILQIPECADLKIRPTTLLGNRTWMKAFQK